MTSTAEGCCCRIAERVIWAAIILIAAILSIYEIIVWLAYFKAWSSDLQTNGNGMASRAIPFPRITFCSRASVDANHKQFSELHQRNYALSLTMPSASVEVLDAVNATSLLQPATFASTKTLFEQDLNRSGVSLLTAVLALGYHCRDFMMTCKIRNVSFPCCQSSVQVPTHYGPCFALDAPVAQTVPGYRGKLTLRLFVNDANFQKFSKLGFTHPGFFMFLDSFNYFPQEPIFVSLGKEVIVKMDNQHTANLEQPYTSGFPFGGCLKAADGDYRMSADDTAEALEAISYVLNKYRSDRIAVEDCRKDCFNKAVYSICRCYALILTSEDFSPSFPDRYCFANESLCVDAVLTGRSVGGGEVGGSADASSSNATQARPSKTSASSHQTTNATIGAAMFDRDNATANSTSTGKNSGRGSGKRGTGNRPSAPTKDPISSCAQACPGYCFNRAAVAQQVQVADLNGYTYQSEIRKDLLPQSALIHLYYGGANFAAVKELTPLMTRFHFLREMGLSLCIWTVLALITIASLWGMRAIANFVLVLIYGPNKHRINPYPVANGQQGNNHNFEGEAADGDGK